MKADFFKRIFAYLIDYFIIMIVLMGITASVNVGSDLTKEINDEIGRASCRERV